MNRLILPALAGVTAFTSREKSGDSFHIGTVSQKCAIEVNTKEAAAETHAGMFLESAMPPGRPVTFTVDRPFIFMIREASTGAILFIGQKVN